MGNMSDDDKNKAVKNNLQWADARLREVQFMEIEHEKSITNLFLGLSGALLAFTSNIIVDSNPSGFAKTAIAISVIAAGLSIVIGAYRVILRTSQFKMLSKYAEHDLATFMTAAQKSIAVRRKPERDRRIQEVFDSDKSEAEKLEAIANLLIEIPDAEDVESDSTFERFILRSEAKLFASYLKRNRTLQPFQIGSFLAKLCLKPTSRKAGRKIQNSNIEIRNKFQ